MGAVVVVVGAADSLEEAAVPWLTKLLSRGLAGVARDSGALVIDGGTDAGAMAVLGRSLADHTPHAPLLGVAPARKVSFPGGPAADGERAPLEPHHTHFVLADGAEWGDETDLLFELADVPAADVPVVAVLVGGGPVAENEVLHVVRRRWPLVVVTGSGGMADRVAEAVGAPHGRLDAPVLDEVVADGDIELVPLQSEPRAFAGVLTRLLHPDQSLELAWEQFAVLDHNAIRQQREFRRVQGAILVLGVVGTLLAVVQGTLQARDGEEGLDILRYVLILVPIAGAGLLTAAARFSPGTRWVVLRGSAEAVKREIFRYRARAGVYSDAAHARTRRQVRLAERVGTITARLMQTDVNRTALRPHGGPVPPPASVDGRDDGMSVLSPERYLDLRLRHQAGWYERRIVEVERRLRRARWAVIVIGGVGTFLAAVGLELWIAFTTALVGALTAFLEYVQVESLLLHYNQAAADLETIRRWWVSLSPQAKRRQANVNRLVDYTERIMQSESAGWLQEMQDAMAELRQQQEEAEDTEDEEPAAEAEPQS